MTEHPLLGAARVVNIRSVRAAPADYSDTVDITRGGGTRWGNPFVIGVDGDRAAVIRKYRARLRRQFDADPEDLSTALLELEGKTLVCWCFPKPCHGNVLLEAIEWARAYQTAKTEANQ